MTQLGADPDQLRGLAGILRSAAGRSTTSRSGCPAVFAAPAGTDPMRTRFEREWQIRHRPALRATVGRCSALARTLEQQVAEQLRVSIGRATRPDRSPRPGGRTCFRPAAASAPLPTIEDRYEGGVALHGAVVTAASRAS